MHAVIGRSWMALQHDVQIATLLVWAGSVDRVRQKRRVRDLVGVGHARLGPGIVHGYGVCHFWIAGHTVPMPRTQRLTMDLPEVARQLGISRAGAYAAAARGEIPVIKIGKRLVVPRASFDRMLGLTPESQSRPSRSATPHRR